MGAAIISKSYERYVWNKLVSRNIQVSKEQDRRSDASRVYHVAGVTLVRLRISEGPPTQCTTLTTKIFLAHNSNRDALTRWRGGSVALYFRRKQGNSLVFILFVSCMFPLSSSPLTTLKSRTLANTKCKHLLIKEPPVEPSPLAAYSTDLSST
jgi:hypothetical protein